MSKTLILSCLTFALISSLAHGQAVAVVEAAPWWGGVWDAIAPALILAITGLIGTLATILAAKLNAWFNVTNEIQVRANEVLIRNVLHDAVWSAVKVAAVKTGVTLPQLNGTAPMPKVFMDTAIDYVRTKNPDTAVAAGLMPDAEGNKNLSEIILSKVPDLIKMLSEPQLVIPIPNGDNANIPPTLR